MRFFFLVRVKPNSRLAISQLAARSDELIPSGFVKSVNYPSRFTHESIDTDVASAEYFMPLSSVFNYVDWHRSCPSVQVRSTPPIAVRREGSCMHGWRSVAGSTCKLSTVAN